MFVIMLLFTSYVAFAADVPQIGDQVPTEIADQLQDVGQGVTMHIGALIAVNHNGRWCYGRFRTAVSSEVLVLTAPSNAEVLPKNKIKILPNKEVCLTQKSGQ